VVSTSVQCWWSQRSLHILVPGAYVQCCRCVAAGSMVERPVGGHGAARLKCQQRCMTQYESTCRYEARFASRYVNEMDAVLLCMIDEEAQEAEISISRRRVLAAWDETTTALALPLLQLHRIYHSRPSHGTVQEAVPHEPRCEGFTHLTCRISAVTYMLERRAP